LDPFDVDKHDVNSIFIDETEINIGGNKAWLWVAYEPQLKAFLSFHISWHQNSLMLFHKEACKEVWQEDYLHRRSSLVR
jgi:hypothetical protein